MICLIGYDGYLLPGFCALSGYVYVYSQFMSEQQQASDHNMSGREQTPHDAMIKKAFEDKLLAIMFFRLVLPRHIASKINWQTLEPAKDTFVTDNLKRLNIDLLFTVRYYDNTMVCLMLMLEHKSYLPDQHDSIDLQLINYQAAVYTHQYGQHQKANEARKAKGQPAEPLKFSKIIPVVLYHGNRPWKVKSWKALLSVEGVPEADDLPGLAHTYVLQDLQKMTEGELQQFYKDTSKLLVMALCLKHCHHKQFIDKLPQLYQLAREMTKPAQAVEIIDALGVYLGYLVEPEDYPRVLTITEQIDTDLNRKFMSIIEYTEKKGIAEGIAKGKVEEKLLNKSIVKALREGAMTPIQIAKSLEVPLDDVLDWKHTLGM